jgi:CHAT domain-containing protein/tetratricopeptide (TPR) repeat protein
MDPIPQPGNKSDDFDRLPLLLWAKSVAAGELSLSRARAQVLETDNTQLSAWLDETWRSLQQVLDDPSTPLAFRQAVLELGTEAALKVSSALHYLNFAMNLGHLLCTELNEVRRGLELLEGGMQQLTVLKLPPSDIAQVILAVADAYMTHHKEMGPEYLKVAAEGYSVALEMTQLEGCSGDQVARAHAGVGLCLAEGLTVREESTIANAITHYETALQHLNFRHQPFLGGLILHNLGNAHFIRRDGDRAANLRRSVACFEEALKLREPLANARGFRFTCSRLADVEEEMGHPMRAVALYERAIETLNPIHERLEYAELHSHLAALCRRASHSTTNTGHEFLNSLAMASNTVARNASGPRDAPDLWARATAGLAALRQQSGNLEGALALHDEIFQKLDRKTSGHRLALIAFDHIQLLILKVRALVQTGQRDTAIKCKQKAHETARMILKSDLESWRQLFARSRLVRIDELLASTDDQRRKFEKEERELLASALAAMPVDTPRQNREDLENQLFALVKDEDSSSQILAVARSRLRNEADFLRGNPSFIDFHNYCQENHDSWNAVVKDALKEGNITAAWLNADRCRARSLDLLNVASEARRHLPSEARARPYLPEAFRAEYATLVAEWLTNMAEDDIDAGHRRDALSPWLTQKITETVQWRGHWLLESGQSIEDAEIPLPIFNDAATAIIEYWTTPNEAQAFVFLPGKACPEVLQLPELVWGQQIDWVKRWFECYGEFESRGYAVVRKWARLLDELSLQIGNACLRPLHDLLAEHQIERLILIPDFLMDTLPLLSMSISLPQGRAWINNLYEVAFCPSLRQLARSRSHEGAVNDNLLFIGNPQEKCPTGECIDRCRLSLPMASVELTAIRQGWPNVCVIQGHSCTPHAVLEQLEEQHPQLLHFCTHAQTRFDDPLASGFVLSHDGQLRDDPLSIYVGHRLNQVWGSAIAGEVLTLDQILRQVDLAGCRLAFLNACETGLNDIQYPREHLSLAAAMLAAGVATVIAPLWPITEAAAGLLSTCFYSELRRDSTNKLRALTTAQRWLQQLSYEDASKRTTPQQLAAAVMLSGSEQPFAHPFFWAPFQLFGSPL